MRDIVFRAASIIILLIYGCTPNEDENTFVVTEQVLHVSGEKIRLLGRVISNQEVQVSDHGFYFSQDPNFNTSTIVSLGEKNGPGRFIAAAEDLNVGELYFVKSFMELSGEIVFGNVLEVSTLDPVLDSFSPAFGVVGEQLTLVGRNFTEDMRVFFGEQEAQIVNLQFESKAIVTIPPILDNPSVPITVLIQDQEITSQENFVYQIGKYDQVSTFPESVRLYENAFFQNAKGLHIGLGTASKVSLFNHFQRYDPVQGNWEQVDFPGAPKLYSFFTDHYIGGGTSLVTNIPLIFSPTFWKVTDSGFQQLDDLPFDVRGALAFEIGDKLYLLGDQDLGTPILRVFDPALNQWKVLAEPPAYFGSENAVFTYNGYGFVVASDQSIWRFDPKTDSWEVVSSYPGSIGQGYGMARVIGDKAYIGLFRRTNEMWELDLNSMEWVRKNPMPGYPQSIVVGHFAYGQTLFIMRVPDLAIGGSYPMDLYQFDPNGF